MQRVVQNKRFFLVCLFVLILLSAVVLHFVIQPHLITHTLHDAPTYQNPAEQILSSGNLYDPLRTYGYPLYLALISRISPGDSAIDLARRGQFLFHTYTAFLAVGIFANLRKDNTKETQWLKLLVFSLVILSPILLPLTHEILTESLAVFFVTLFCWAVTIPNKKWSWPVAGFALGVAAIIRPFHHNLALVLAVLYAVLFCVDSIQKKRERLTIWLSLKKGVMILIPFLVIVATQYAVVYNTEGTFAFVGEQMRGFQDTHLIEGFYSYKYETLLSADYQPPLYYFSPERKEIITHAAPESMYEIASEYLRVPLSTIHMTAIKVVGLFQNYDWSYTYRLSADNSNVTHPIFVYGFVIVYGLVYLIQYNMAEHRKLLGELLSGYAFLLAIIMLYLLVYGALTVPESRFIAPIIPILTVATIYTLIRDHYRSRLLFSFLVSIVLYAITYHTLVTSVQVIPK
jgi:hypothetical protein